MSSSNHEKLLLLAEQHLTVENISMGISALLAISGFLHAVPGPTLRIQARELGMPAWFIVCAGILMMGSSALYHLRPVEGLFAVCLCMGGTTSTAALLPSPMHRAGGALFSGLTLAAAFWVASAEISFAANFLKEHNQLSIRSTSKDACLCVAAFCAGVAGRVFVPVHPKLVKLFSSNSASKDMDKNAKKSDSKVSNSGNAKKIGERMPEKKQEVGKGSANKRTQSPAQRTNREI